MNAIIFDLDGVLCHTDEYHYMAWKAIADELHPLLSLSELLAIEGHPA